MTETTTCEICHERLARPGMKTCWTCNGFPDRDEEKNEMPPEEIVPKPNPEMGHCEACGEDFEPYKNGSVTILTVCHTCLMKRKYGPDWTPGDRREKDRIRAANNRKRLREAKEKATECQDPNEPGVNGPIELVNPLVTIAFMKDDQALYDRLMATAKRERRTPESQILYWLDRVAEG